MKLIIKSILESDIRIKKSILLLFDLLVIILSIYITPILINFYDKNPNYNIKLLVIYSLFIALPFYIISGQYKGITRYFGSQSTYQLCIRNFIFLVILNLFIFVTSKYTLSFNFNLVAWILIILVSSSFRFLFRDLIILRSISKIKNDNKVIIYGAGTAGLLLLKSLQFNNIYLVKGFIDDDPSLWGRNILGIEIYPPSKLQNLIQRNRIQKILLALPSIQNQDYKRILNFLKGFNINVLKVPSLKNILSGKEQITSLKPIRVEELLSRDIISNEMSSLKFCIEKSVVLVTGAGGSIGSELCRQLMIMNPAKILLFDSSEPYLYSIHQNLLDMNQTQIEILPILGNATDSELVERIFRENKINIVFHTAAYKHVPMVEMNPIQGMQNNIFSTYNLCKYSYEYCIDKFILISSDKAVRPTNVMGASKRISELIVQSFDARINNPQNSHSAKCIFSMVRFGNVLNSSGSVIPLFEKQIAEGGPITLTHENVTRYFMTITEAVNLVLQTILLAEGGEIFLLEMGDAIKIKSVAEKMIHLSGLTIKNDENLNGDIEIVVKGLRPGEKLFEELLIDNKSLPTENRYIYKAEEKFFSFDFVESVLEDLKIAINSQDKEKLYKFISILVPEWKNIYK